MEKVWGKLPSIVFQAGEVTMAIEGFEESTVASGPEMLVD